ncbi:unnamed protein product [Cladocopium goreaui]|uniref:Ribosomal protein n=1 Tax=Cladocopium goreaui TaxID=2562237 RepID=A0A9P1D4V6_9DINO|nr:unnamed protein product [Cladocopium goreaui]
MQRFAQHTSLKTLHGPWQCVLGGLPSIAVGSVRTKKWKPFHSMYRANRLREIRQKEAEDAQAAAAEAEAAADARTVARKADEPRVGTTPFQAARLMRAFDVLPEEDAVVTFQTRLNVDLTRESVRGTCNLPHGLSTKMRVLAFCPDDQIEEMLEAGADVAGITEPLRRIGQGWMGFDRCLATPSIMPQVMKVAKVLGPRKMMPNPKSGTVVPNLKVAIKEAKSGSLLEYRAEGEGDLKATIGNGEFSDAKILENLKFFVQTLLRARPRSSTPGAETGTSKQPPGTPLIGGQGASAGGAEVKENYFREAHVRLGTRGPPIRIDPESMMPASAGYFR